MRGTGHQCLFRAEREALGHRATLLTPEVPTLGTAGTRIRINKQDEVRSSGLLARLCLLPLALLALVKICLTADRHTCCTAEA